MEDGRLRIDDRGWHRNWIWHREWKIENRGWTMGIIRGFRELDVYMLAREQAKNIFTVSKSFPKEERY